ncbi:hypothetical protein C5167_033984 [Papaver somniferum]|uniref:Uncharacterized protein n=2 Tax=Papaver somniferum TaxID=3469 RepID=A0A4Y7KFT1_PAPSO|nr:hypothetical protein C5167_033984 [Papaver somniferum]
MIRRKLCLEDIDDVILLWMSEHGVPWTLKNDHAFFWFWENAAVNNNGCIQLLVKVQNPEWDKEHTPKKTAPKSPQVRRSPRLEGKNNKSVGGSSARKLFGQDCSQPIQASVVGDNLRRGTSSKPVLVDEEPVQVDDDWDEDYWLQKLKENDEIVVQLENKEVDECHPVEDPEAAAAAAYNSDEDNEDASDVEHVGDEDDSSDDGAEVNEEGTKCSYPLIFFFNGCVMEMVSMVVC